MKYFATVGDREFEIEIVDSQVLVDGEPVDVDLQQSGASGLFSALVNGDSYELFVENQGGAYAVTLRGEQIHVAVEDERSRRLSAGRRGPALPHGKLPVRAPIPGLVIKVLVAEGDTVAEDQPLVILEAMKMENEIRALRAGVVRKVEVAAGERVEQNALLLILG